MNTLTPRELRIVDGIHQRCSNVAHGPDAQYRVMTVHACTLKCGWAVGLLLLYAFFTLLAQIV